MDGLLQEAGGHRIQRVPPNEKRDRVHSSTVTVSVLPEARQGSSHPAAQRDPGDYHLEWYSGSGAGGQHRNKHMNSARLRHMPTGLVVTSQCRKRPNSEAEARGEMEARLDALLAADGHSSLNGSRSAQIGTGARADKRRTYRFQEGLVTDHLTGRTAKIGRALKGEMDRLWA